MTALKHSFANTNGIRMHFVEQGEGPLVVMCHGWPESWYSYRHQIPVIANAGFRAVAPDQRGYGQTDAPEPIEEYHALNLVGDIVGLVNSLGADPAVVVGHDWGALVAAYCALLRPDLFRALVLLSVPYIPRSPVRPAVMYKMITQEKNFYQDYFQEPGKAERELEADVRRTMLGLLYGASGDPAPERRWQFLFDKSKRLIDTIEVPERLPSWLTQQDLDFFVGEFQRTGFRGGINWYRNFDRDWELTPFLDGAKILQPTLFITGDRDLVMDMAPDAYRDLELNVLKLRKKILIPGAGHWIQQERPGQVNDLILEFLRGL